MVDEGIDAENNVIVDLREEGCADMTLNSPWLRIKSSCELFSHSDKFMLKRKKFLLYQI
jgi:hypothetical protein